MRMSMTLILLCLNTLGGCSSAPWLVADADASARTVTMACSARIFISECTQFDSGEIQQAATSACQRLGFDAAESFGSVGIVPLSSGDQYRVLFACQDR